MLNEGEKELLNWMKINFMEKQKIYNSDTFSCLINYMKCSLTFQLYSHLDTTAVNYFKHGNIPHHIQCFLEWIHVTSNQGGSPWVCRFFPCGVFYCPTTPKGSIDQKVLFEL